MGGVVGFCDPTSQKHHSPQFQIQIQIKLDFLVVVAVVVVLGGVDNVENTVSSLQQLIFLLLEIVDGCVDTVWIL